MNYSPRPRFLFTPAVFVLFALSGCGGDARVAEVGGTILLDGNPVADASVAFMPSEGGRPAFGITDAEGKYALSTFETDDGALIGPHAVTVTLVEEAKASDATYDDEGLGSLEAEMQTSQKARDKWIVPERYADAETSGLNFEVTRGQQNVADFSLTSQP